MATTLQVYQAMRSCRGIAPVCIPGASELEDLVASAEAWAAEACRILKIKVCIINRWSTQIIGQLDKTRISMQSVTIFFSCFISGIAVNSA